MNLVGKVKVPFREEIGIKQRFNEQGKEWIINEIKISELRGRGGAGFPTGVGGLLLLKNWDHVRTMIINADESNLVLAKIETY